MLLNSRYNNFSFQFPPNWFPQIVIDRYTPFFRRLAIPFTTLNNFMSYTVQSISWPSIDGQTVEQTVAKEIRVYPSGKDSIWQMSRDVTITFRTIEGYLNYFVMFDTWEQYWNGEMNMPSMPDFILRILDNYGYQVIALQWHNPVYKGLSELELSAASNVPEFRTFSANFSASWVETKREFQ